MIPVHVCLGRFFLFKLSSEHSKKSSNRNFRIFSIIPKYSEKIFELKKFFLSCVIAIKAIVFPILILNNFPTREGATGFGKGHRSALLLSSDTMQEKKIESE